MRRTIQQIKSELKAVIDEGLEAGNRGDAAAVKSADEECTRLVAELKTAERERSIRNIGLETYDVGGHGLAQALLDAGWDRKTHPSVTVDQHYALGVRFKTGGVDGGIDGTEVVDQFVAPLLGADQRFIYPHVRTQPVAFGDTGVQSYRQKSRQLASTSDMIRSIADTSTKPETDTTAEVVNEPLKQIAHISTGTPNVLLANDSFRSWVNSDLTAGYRNAVDAHIVTEVQGAGIPGGGGGSNIYEDILYSQEVVRAAGYSPNLVVLSPGDGLALQLLQLTGATVYAFAQQPPTVVVTPSIGDGDGFVADSTAIGIMFLSPFSLQVFEENAGSSNSSTVRAESNGLFLVQRPDAAATLAAS
jgi:hypothetical protein